MTIVAISGYPDEEQRYIMDMLGDTLDNVDRGCVYQRQPILRHFEQAAET